MLPVPPPFTNLSSIPMFCIAFTICSLLSLTSSTDFCFKYEITLLLTIDSVYDRPPQQFELHIPLHHLTLNMMTFSPFLLLSTHPAHFYWGPLYTKMKLKEATTHINIQTNTKTSFRFLSNVF